MICSEFITENCLATHYRRMLPRRSFRHQCSCDNDRHKQQGELDLSSRPFIVVLLYNDNLQSCGQSS